MRSPTEHRARIRTLIVDDEPLARSNLSVLLRRDPGIEIVGECGSGAEAIGRDPHLTTRFAFSRRADAGVRRLRRARTVGKRSCLPPSCSSPPTISTRFARSRQERSITCSSPSTTRDSNAPSHAQNRTISAGQGSRPETGAHCRQERRRGLLRKDFARSTGSKPPTITPACTSDRRVIYFGAACWNWKRIWIQRCSAEFIDRPS